jgi:hypothetical protein
MGTAIDAGRPLLRPAFERLESRFTPARAASFGLAAPGAAAPAGAAPRKEVVFIDPRVPDAPALAAAAAAARFEVYLLDGDDDGLRQIARTLAGRHALLDDYVVSHGAPGTLFLGDCRLDRDTLAGDRAYLEAIAGALLPGCDLLLYGCDAAWGGVGDALLDTLAEATGAVVAGSTHPVGPRALGGDWQLDRATGPIAARPTSATGPRLAAGSSAPRSPSLALPRPTP